MAHFIPRLIRKLGLASKANQYAQITENGRSFKIPLLGGLGYSNLNLSEPWMTKLLEQTKPLFQNAKDTFVDVGTNIGQTLIKLRSVCPDMPYVGFEPNPSCVYYMNELIRVNRFRDTQLYPFGISDTASVLSLHFYSEHDEDSSASLIEEFRPDQRVFRSIHVPVFPVTAISLDQKVGFLKIDVEGGEWEVLQGFESILKRDQPVVQTEILPAYKADNNKRLDRQTRIEKMMTGLNYQCYRVIRSDEQSPYLWKISQIGVHSNVSWSDYLWVPLKKAESLETQIEVRTTGPSV